MDDRLVNVVVASPLHQEALELIKAVSRINLEQVSALIVAERKGDGAAGPQLDSILAQAEVLYGWIHHLPPRLVTRARNLKWLQVMSAGVDRLPKEILQSQVIVTNVSGIHATPISEFVLYLMLSAVKQAPACFQMKQEKRWQRLYPATLRSKTVGIVGLGNIGREIARLSKAFGLRVIGTRRSARKAGRARYVDSVLPREQLSQLLSESDFVVLALPLTPESHNLFGEKELRAMKPGAYLINISRGAIVDEEALIRALEEKWIAGAGLDVFATEPLSSESKIWELPNVIFSPHISGEMENYEVRATEVFCKNLRRYVEGRKFARVVDPKKGY